MSWDEMFSAFFEAIWDHAPFGWQRRLVAEVQANGWPALMSLPTGSGKTASLDVALFLLAMAPEVHPRRIVMVVDRRLIVDQAADRARRLMAALTHAEHGVVRDIADRLRKIWGAKPEDVPFSVAVLRGGMPLEAEWAERPDRPLVLLSTVDQAGSRLLFRGYGVSERMAPVHAGLFGNDCLWLLDEVHLSVPFAETLGALATRWRGFRGEAASKQGLPDRWRVVRMSATPGLDEAAPFVLDEADHAHPVLAKRLRASKPTRLVTVKAARDPAITRAALAKEAAGLARGLLGSGRTAVAVVMNRVETARLAWQELNQDSPAYDVVLLTGRMRPLDRDDTVGALLPRVLAGRAEGEARPLVVVATQCIEAGADFDFDALVTECASLDALRQRFGRLDRRGERGSAGACPGVVMAPSDLGPDDPVYGDRMLLTWRWLQSVEPLDFGIDTLDVSLRAHPDPSALCAPRPHAPTLLQQEIDAWAQTARVPATSPEVAAWLHGPERDQAEVLVVWRADLSEDDLLQWDLPEVREAMEWRLGVCPPVENEAMAVPLHAVRRWLEGAVAGSVADVPLAPEAGAPDRVLTAPLRALRWREGVHLVDDPRWIRPGDTLVVPHVRGGVSGGTWDPTASAPVPDLGYRCHWERTEEGTLKPFKGRRVLRLDPRVLSDVLDPEGISGLGVLLGALSAGEGLARVLVAEWLGDVKLCPELRLGFVVAHGAGGWAILEGGKARQVSTESDAASFVGEEVTLLRHSEDVRGWVSRFARHLGVSQEISDDLALAAWFHDVGKADPRFQQMLVGGDPVKLAGLAEPLAKSERPAQDRAARELARRRSGYPSGQRHELLSVAMAEGHTRVAQAHDRDLVLHLIASHHGWCRPFAPPVIDDDPREVRLEHGDSGELRGRSDHHLARLNSGVAERFWTVTRRYGWWGLAWLEAVLRLADHRASAEGGA